MKLRRVIYLLFVFTFTLPVCYPGPAVFCYFSAFTKSKIQVHASTLQVAIDDLRVGGVDAEGVEENGYSGVLEINTSQIFSFSVTNLGSCDIGYALDIQTAWDDGLDTSGKLFIYPADSNDGDIYESLKNGDYPKPLANSDILYASADSLKESKSYSLKLFFYADKEISGNPQLFNNKSLRVGIVAHADICGRKTGWATTVERFFNLKSLINTEPPVVSQISLPKTFFVGQAANLDLKTYAAAYDQSEGDITNRIEISSWPEFNPDKAGEYKITYAVCNSAGIPAVPLQISVIVWDFVKIESGGEFTLALTSHGRVYSWGYNYYGQLGDGTNAFKSKPQLVSSLDGITDIAAGETASYALSADGQIYSWGNNEYGQLGLGRESPASINKPARVAVPDGVKFKKIASKVATAGGITDGGEVYTWGFGKYGALGDGKTSDVYTPAKIGLSGIFELALGQYSGAALTADGMLYTWGSNQLGQLGSGTANIEANLPVVVPYFKNRDIPIRSISVGWVHMVVISQDGRLFGWGYGANGRLGNGSTSIQYTPQQISLPATPQKAAAGYAHTGIMAADGTVFFFGLNSSGQHGNNSDKDNLTPVLLNGLSSATDLSLGRESSFVLASSKDIYGMGYGGYGALGTGNSNNSSVPVKWVFVPPEPY